MPRFQVLVYPDPVEEFVNVDHKPNALRGRSLTRYLRTGPGRSETRRVCPRSRAAGFRSWGLVPPGRNSLTKWRTRLEQRLRSGQESSLITSHLAKYRSLMPSLALIFHLIDSHATSLLEPVSLRAVHDAAAWCEMLEAHCRRIYQSAMDGDLDAAVQLGERIKGKLSNPFTYRAVAMKGWSGLTTTDEVRRAVGILQDRGWVETVETAPDGKKGGRRSELVWVHPNLVDTGRSGTG